MPDLFAFLASGKLTAALALERPRQETKIFFSNGRPVYANSTRAELRLGKLLVRLGKLDPDTFENVIQRRRTWGTRLGQLLVSQKVMTEDELRSCLKVQVSEVVFDTLDWREGVFSVFADVEPPAAAVQLDMNLQNLVMEGVRRSDQREHLRELFPDLDLPLETLANSERVKRTVSLTPEEWQVFFLVDGRRTLKEVCELVGQSDDLATLQILHRLIRGRLVALVGAPAPPAVPGAEPAKEKKQPAGEAPPEPGPQAQPAAEAEPQAEPAHEPEEAEQRNFDVEFTTGRRRRLSLDDSHRVVNPDAIGYLAKAQRVTVSRLVYQKGGQERSCPLVRDSYTLGRHRNNDIVIGDPKVSSFHARIDRSDEGFVFVDLNSRNGCFVNGRRIKRALLNNGDEIYLGPVRLTYRVDYTSEV